MLENAIARRYASAFFTIAQEQGKLNEYEGELEKVINAVEANEDLRKVLTNQLLEAAVKKDIVDQIFTGMVSPITVDFLKVIMDKRREAFLKDIYNAFVVSANEARNVRDAEVTAAKELTVADLAAIKAKLTTLTGKEIRLTSKVDPSLMGGLVVRLGDKVIDGSVTKRLELLKEALLQG
ncbi:MAG: F0F1 ATP synthase subunit delta [Carboxydocellales bacterium]